MRSFVFFLFTCYLAAALYVARIISIFCQALSWGKIGPLEVWQILFITVLMLATIPLFYLMIHNGTSFAVKWISFSVCILCVFSAVITLCYPVPDFPQGVFLGVIGIFSLLWLVIGFHMIRRYCFLIQRGWTEKEKQGLSRDGRYMREMRAS